MFSNTQGVIPLTLSSKSEKGDTSISRVIISLPTEPKTITSTIKTTMDTMETALTSLIEPQSPDNIVQLDQSESKLNMPGKTWPQSGKETHVLGFPPPVVNVEALSQRAENGYRGLNGDNRITYDTNEPRDDIDGPTPERAVWGKKADFLLSVIGFTVDLGNIWRFPYICYKNGGGAFLVPYALMAIFGGVPFLYMEMALGQYQRTGCITVWRRICPIMGGIGYAICIINCYVGFFYSTITAWSVYYLIASFATTLPWTSCDNDWNTEFCASPFAENFSNTSVTPATEFFERKVIGSHLSTGIGDLGGLKWELALCLLLLFVIVYFSIWKGIKASGKVVWVTATLPYFCLIVLLIRGVTLEGASSGIIYYLKPKWHLLRNAGVWVDAAVQVFFSLGPGFGVILAFSSYNKLHNNCFKDALITSGINCFTSFLAGFAIFSVLGFMSVQQGRDIEEVTPDGPGLIYIAIPEAISQLPGSTWWAVIFFVMIISLGLDSTFGGLESIITAWCDRNPKTIGKHREIFVACVVCFIFLGSLTTVTYGGQYVFQLLESYGASTTLLLVVVLEAISITWFYGLQNFTSDIRTMIGRTPSVYWQLCWSILSPAMLLFVVVFGLFMHRPMVGFQGEPYPQWSIGVGWCLTMSTIVCVPAFALYKLLITPGSLKERFVAITSPQEHPDHKTSYDSSSVDSV
ncbi:sodium-dependent serotonin transporter-like [Strongylocentrotus purpuratus]|uniref:Transporter n=1 Tax=Strongylocentrotus purpuratus TaxID=7668 RepID=A0A7M7PUB8_STRPU|nr:sodium-dependent serotonin transporter-like [Strongylocentrotus purpuratus]